MTYANYRAYDDFKKTINIVNVDSNFDLGDSSKPIRNNSYLGKIILEEPHNLFNYTTIGYQTYYNSQIENLVISTSTPLTVGFPALILKWFKKIPFVFEVRDLWPEVPIQMGALNNKIIVNLALWFEKTIYKNAIHVIGLSPGMSQGVIDRNISPEKVSMIPNMSKKDKFWVREKDTKLEAKLGLKKDSFKVIYFGAMGIANGMDYIIDAVKLIKEDQNIEFIFLGDGATKPKLQERCRKESVNTTHFCGKFPMAELSKIVNLSDVSLVTFLNLPILSTNSPNKLFDSLSAGKPIIVNSSGWTKDLVEKYNCGAFVNPETPEELADKILEMKNSPERCKEMGENSRRLAETKYDKSILCKEFVEVIKSFKNIICLVFT